PSHQKLFDTAEAFRLFHLLVLIFYAYSVFSGARTFELRCRRNEGGTLSNTGIDLLGVDAWSRFFFVEFNDETAWPLAGPPYHKLFVCCNCRCILPERVHIPCCEPQKTVGRR